MSNLSALSAGSIVAGRAPRLENPNAMSLACPLKNNETQKIVVTYRDGIELTYLFDASVKIAMLMQLVSRAGTVRKVIL